MSKREARWRQGSSMSTSIFPVILAGGLDRRLRPFSCGHSLLQQAALRAKCDDLFRPMIVVASAEHRFLVAQQLREIEASVGAIVLTPDVQNTAAVVASVALRAQAADPDAQLLVMSADQMSSDQTAFLAAIRSGRPAADTGTLVLFGAASDTVHERSSDVFLLSAKALIVALERHEPDLLAAARKALDQAHEDLDFLRLDPDALTSAAPVSLERVFEHAESRTVVPCDLGFSEVAVEPRRVRRPWGWYEGIDIGERFQVKRITVQPGGKLSLQKHFHRAEHWVVVSGTAEIHLDGEERLLTENQSAYIPLGCVHRLANPGKAPLILIEVQCGPYLGEDDIVRLEDAYARA